MKIKKPRPNYKLLLELEAKERGYTAERVTVLSRQLEEAKEILLRAGACLANGRAEEEDVVQRRIHQFMLSLLPSSVSIGEPTAEFHQWGDLIGVNATVRGKTS